MSHCRTINSPLWYSARRNKWNQDNSPQRQLAPRQPAPHKTRPKTTRPTFCGQLAPLKKTTRPTLKDNSPTVLDPLWNLLHIIRLSFLLLLFIHGPSLSITQLSSNPSPILYSKTFLRGYTYFYHFYLKQRLFSLNIFIALVKISMGLGHKIF